jgi:hypothetical protein
LLGIPLPDCNPFLKDPEEIRKCLKSHHIYEPGFIGDDYWRVLFAFPIGTALLQTILMLTVFNYDTPKYLKQNNQKAKLTELMGKIYSSD